MKNYLLLFFAALFIGCAPTGIQVTVDDEKSIAIQSHFQNYLNNDMDGLKSLWSPDLEVYANSTDPVGLDELVGMLQAQHSTFSPIEMTFGEEAENQPIAWVETTDYPETASSPAATWSQSWFTWTATSKLSGETITLPAHISFQWGDDGKIAARVEKNWGGNGAKQYLLA
jgi:hypothetical protein